MENLVLLCRDLPPRVIYRWEQLRNMCGILDTGPSFQSVNYGYWFKEAFVS